MFTISIKKPSLPYLTIGFALVYLTMAVGFIPGFMRWDANLYTGVLLAPFICTVNSKQLSLRYLLPAIVMLALAVMLPVNTMYFIAMVFTLLLLIENCLGKVSHATLFLLFLVSPVFKYLILFVDFPVRLWLTGKVVALLNLIGMQAIASGNIIVIGKFEFSVDPACAGLNMLIMSLIVCLFVLMHYQKQTGRQLPFLWMAGLFMFTIALNIISNYFRILLLVLFKIMPGTFFHDFVGIACLSIYVIVPLITGGKPFLNRFGMIKASAGLAGIGPQYTVRYPLLHGALLITLIFVATHIINADTLISTKNTIHLPGFSNQRLESGILKFENKEALIYIKPAAFYIPGHDPKICWTGSGYEFKNIRKERLGNHELYTALLQKNNDKIYAAWWFDNGRLKTIDQIKWRWNAAKGNGPFYLVNVNAANQQSLQKQISRLFANSSYLK
ncbi:exosortase N [Mucilaginibacter sp.]|jgi:exosortase N|uniref:exosortase N n=1 Tax=Mucilaginibacter sp. TaxID=1882438 RepID=UPI0035682EA9